MPAKPITLAHTPLHKQIYAKALLEVGASARAVAEEMHMGQDTVRVIRNKPDYDINFLETVKRALPKAFYAVSGLAMSKVTPEKLDACSAPQLMMVAGIGIDKARDMEGSNRPVFNVVSVINDCKSTRDKLESQLMRLQSITCE